MTLRLPDAKELAVLAQVAAEGVHKPGERPFLTPWTEGTPEDRARIVLQGHWDDLASWTPTNWSLGLGVFVSGDEPIGKVNLGARGRLRSGWSAADRVDLRPPGDPQPGLRRPELLAADCLISGQGLGTEARAGLLTLAFDHLGATDAVTEVFTDNHASQGVSRKLGYRPDGISKDARGDEVLVSDRLRLTAETWADISHPPVTVEGVEAARHMFLD